MEFDPVLNSTVATFLQSTVKDIFLNVTETTHADIVFENTTAILINVNNETLAQLMNNLTYANESPQLAQTLPRHFNITSFQRTLMRISTAAGYIYMLLAVLGVVLNANVLVRLAQLAYNDYDRFQNGCGLPLAAMSAADLISLMSIIVTVTLSAFFPPHFFAIWARSLQCKATMFLIHSATSFSTWCWLFVSGLRYMAVYHPIWHISRWKFGYGSLFCMLFFILMTNSWLLLSVVGFPHTCGEVPLMTGMDLNRMIHGFELFVSYILPAILTFGLDVRVLITRPPEFQALSATPSVDLLSKRTSSEKRVKKSVVCWPKLHQKQKTERQNSNQSNFIYASLSEDANNNGNAKNNFCKQKKQQLKPQNSSKHQTVRARSAVLRWLTITTVDLLLNAPDNFLRIVSIVSGSNPRRQNSAAHHLIALVARLLYFAQFCFNAFYLSTIVYRRNVESAKSRQQRLRHERKVWCRNCTCLHEFEGKCTSSLIVSKSTIRRRYSAEPGIPRPQSASPRMEPDCLALTELVRAPSLPLIGEATKLLNTSLSMTNDSIEDESCQTESLLKRKR